MDVVFESEVLLGDQDRAHDHLRSLLVSTTDPSTLSRLWRVYGRFCLRSGDRTKAAELAFQESLKYSPTVESVYLLFGVLASSQRVKQAVSLLNDTSEVFGLVLRYTVGNQKLLLRNALLPGGDESDNETSDIFISEILRLLVVKYRLVDFFASVRAALPEGFQRRRATELSVLEGRVHMARKNWKAAVTVLQPLKISDSSEVSCLLAECYVQLHDAESALGILHELSISLMSGPQTFERPAELLDGADVAVSPLVMLFRLGHLLFKRKRWSEALAIFNRLAKVNDSLASIFAGISACHIQLGDFAASLEAAKKACALDPLRADVWGLSSLAMLHLEMWQSAEVCFNLYLDRLVPGTGAALISFWLLIDLGFAWASKRPGVIGGGKAEACALQALRISGASPKVHWLLGESMVASKMTDRGVMEMLTAVQAYGKSAGDENDNKAQREQVLLRALSLCNSTTSGQLFETVKAAIIKNAPHLLGKVVNTAAPTIPKLALNASS